MAETAVADIPAPSWIGEVLDGGGAWSLRAKVPYLLGLLMLCDSWDSVVIAYTLPVLVSEWHLSALQGGWLISAGYGGQFIGAIVFGSLAERYGRLPVFKLLVLVMSLLALGCAAARNYEQLIILRAAQGLAIGGALPISICYINEIAPTATRGRFFGTFQFLMTIGFGLAALSSAWLIPAFGWRIMFALGAAPLFLLPFTQVLPESPRWLARRGEADRAAASLKRLGGSEIPGPDARPPIPGGGTRVPFAMLLAPEVRKISIVTALLWFLTSLVSFGLVTWIPSIFVSMFKIPVADALRYNAIVAISIFFLPLLLRQTIDHIGRRPPAIIGPGVGGIALLIMLFLNLDARLWLVGLAIIGQIGISVGSMLLWPYTAETYATRIRSLALGTSSSIARGASMLTPLLVGGVLEMTGSITLIFLVFGLASLAVALLWLFGVAETAGREMVD
ncbi:MAG TPA: MFS transporter [Sphingomonadaceae bacterium]|nr:MFS transporter [Sphingomonadaceae bacterium]